MSLTMSLFVSRVIARLFLQAIFGHLHYVNIHIESKKQHYFMTLLYDFKYFSEQIR